MKEWRNKNLGSISIQIQTGPFGSQLHQSDYSDIGTPVIMPKDIVDGKISDDSIARVEEAHVNRLARHKVNEGDIIYPRRGDVRKCAYTVAEQSGWLCGTGCLRVTIDNKKAVPKYVFYHLQEEKTRGWIEKHAIGATMLNLNTSILSNIPLRIPRLDVQKKIATILSRYDSLIDNYQKQIKLLEEAAQRLYKEWFVNLRFPGHENTKIVDGVPEGWEKKKIADVTIKVTTGLNPRKNFVLGHGENYYVTIKNMGKNTFFLDEKCDKVDDEAIAKINKRSDLKKGDILFSGIGTIGRVALIDIPTSNWNVSESVFTLRANENISKEYLYLMLLDSNMQNYCQSHSHGAAQKGIRMADLKAFSFPLASKSIIDLFTSKAEPLLNRVSKIRRQLRLLTESRDRLLPKLLSGEIEV